MSSRDYEITLSSGPAQVTELVKGTRHFSPAARHHRGPILSILSIDHEIRRCYLERRSDSGLLQVSRHQHPIYCSESLLTPLVLQSRRFLAAQSPPGISSLPKLACSTAAPLAISSYKQTLPAIANVWECGRLRFIFSWLTQRHHTSDVLSPIAELTSILKYDNVIGRWSSWFKGSDHVIFRHPSPLFHATRMSSTNIVIGRCAISVRVLSTGSLPVT